MVCSSNMQLIHVIHSRTSFFFVANRLDSSCRISLCLAEQEKLLRMSASGKKFFAGLAMELVCLCLVHLVLFTFVFQKPTSP